MINIDSCKEVCNLQHKYYLLFINKISLFLFLNGCPFYSFLMTYIIYHPRNIIIKIDIHNIYFSKCSGRLLSQCIMLNLYNGFEPFMLSNAKAKDWVWPSTYFHIWDMIQSMIYILQLVCLLLSFIHIVVPGKVPSQVWTSQTFLRFKDVETVVLLRCWEYQMQRSVLWQNIAHCTPPQLLSGWFLLDRL